MQMIVNIFTVRGRETFDDDILVCRQRLEFRTGLGGESKLIIVPKPGAEGAHRMLKIVADTIDTGTGVDAQITYNLDGRLGLDPETKAENGERGDPDFGPLDSADPHFGPGDPAGDYPQAQNGGHGQHGGRGGNGTRGQDGPILEIWTNRIEGDGLTIDLRGQEGGDGGRGGRGQNGGNGQRGANAIMGDNWVGLPACDRGPGMGGNGGDGGNAGWGGDGGDGGNGGVVKVFRTPMVGPMQLSKLHFQLEGGKGGTAGAGGSPGDGGRRGAPGMRLLCSAAPEAQDGNDGMTIAEMVDREEGVPQSSDGEPGADGYHRITEIIDLPVFP